MIWLKIEHQLFGLYFVQVRVGRTLLEGGEMLHVWAAVDAVFIYPPPPRLPLFPSKASSTAWCTPGDGGTSLRPSSGRTRPCWLTIAWRSSTTHWPARRDCRPWRCERRCLATAACCWPDWLACAPLTKLSLDGRECGLREIFAELLSIRDRTLTGDTTISISARFCIVLCIFILQSLFSLFFWSWPHSQSLLVTVWLPPCIPTFHLRWFKCSNDGLRGWKHTWKQSSSNCCNSWNNVWHYVPTQWISALFFSHSQRAR